MTLLNGDLIVCVHILRKEVTAELGKSGNQKFIYSKENMIFFRERERENKYKQSTVITTEHSGITFIDKT